jgi:division protein CdvB (Snf7/Vps24/ESCRT-III family)
VVQPTQVSDLAVSLNTELESLKQQFSNLQAKLEEQRVQDQEKIVLLTKALDHQEAMLQELINQIIPQFSRQVEPVEQTKETGTMSQTSTLEMDSEMAETTDTDSSKRDNDKANEAVHRSTQESSKRIDARPSPQKQPDFHQYE